MWNTGGNLWTGESYGNRAPNIWSMKGQRGEGLKKKTKDETMGTPCVIGQKEEESEEALSGHSQEK